jgi:hypothetical protein
MPAENLAKRIILLYQGPSTKEMMYISLARYWGKNRLASIGTFINHLRGEAVRGSIDSKNIKA